MNAGIQLAIANTAIEHTNLRRRDFFAIDAAGKRNEREVRSEKSVSFEGVDALCACTR